MAKVDSYENRSMKAMLENMRVVTNIFASNPGLERAVRRANVSTTAPALQAAAGITNEFNSIFSGNDTIIKSFLGTFTFQTELLRSTQQFYQTEAIHTFRNSLIHNHYFSAIQTIKQSLQSSIIEVPDLALLRLNKPLLELIDIDLPRGLRKSIDSLHIKTARDLSVSDGISYNCEASTFFVETSPDDSCSAKEMNVIFSAAKHFNGITEEELISFLRHLSAYASLGSSHYVGKKIMEMVERIETVISFDSDYYYHARTLDDDVCPYTDEDMTCAPHGITSFGRFNHIGDNYFYFSDQKSGAVEEVRKHSPQHRVQVAKLTGKGTVKLVDISQNDENVFLKYCRFPFDSKSIKKVPREYLIPSFFSDCCKLQGFDGIKYYGTKSYHNYVTWKDGHFVFVDQEILDLAKAASV